MKIVVYHDENDGWAWKIVQKNVGIVAVSNHINYERKSDAKRGAHRFERQLYLLYTEALDPNSDFTGIEIQVAK